MKQSAVQLIGFDADDTLWPNMPFFTETEKRFCSLLGDYGTPEAISAEQYATEKANMPLYGFGSKGFTLSMLETALRLTDGRLPGRTALEILELGKGLLRHPVRVMDGVDDVLAALRQRFVLVVATKGDLLEQERKLEQSGLARHFHHIEIMSDKRTGDYQAMLERLGVGAGEFLMVGNSVKSDIEPVLALGSYAAHVPYHDTWVHEMAEPPVGNPRFFELATIGDLPALPVLGF